MRTIIGNLYQYSRKIERKAKALKRLRRFSWKHHKEQSDQTYSYIEESLSNSSQPN